MDLKSSLGIDHPDKADLIEEHRDINVDHEWWDEVFQMFRTDLHEQAGFMIRTGTFAFSGFCSQGDGASFEGEDTDPVKFLDAMTEGDKTQFPTIRRLLAYGGGLNVRGKRHSNRYSHSGTMFVEISSDWFRDMVSTEGSELREQVVDRWDETLTAEILRFEDDAQSFLRGKADELYKQLEDDYEYWTSDEAVWGTITINELHLEQVV